MHQHDHGRVTRRRFLSGGLAAVAGLTVSADRLSWAVPSADRAAASGDARIVATTAWEGGIVALVATAAGTGLQRVRVNRSGGLTLGDLLVTALPPTLDARALTADDQHLVLAGAAEVVAGQATVCTDRAAVDAGELDAWGLTTLDLLTDSHRWSAALARIGPDLGVDLAEVDVPTTGRHSWLLDVDGPGGGTALLGTGGPGTAEATYADSIHLVERAGGAGPWRRTPLAAGLGEQGCGVVSASSPAARPVSFVSGRAGTMTVFRGPTIIESGLPGSVVGLPITLPDRRTLVATASGHEGEGRSRLWSIAGGRVAELGAQARQALDPDARALVGGGARAGEVVVRRADGSYAVRTVD